MTRKRGGQRKHWAEIARVWAWYQQIKSRCDYSDYELDREFAWTESGRKKRDKEVSEGTRGAALTDRPRTFEWIRKEARMPAGRDPRWRGMSELVDAVDQHPLLAGTKALYEAEIWSMFQETTVKPDLLQSRIEQLLDAHDLVRVPFGELGPSSDRLIIEHGHASLYDSCLLLSMRKMRLLYRSELLWCLFVENEPAYNWENRATLASRADETLEMFFYTYLPDRCLQFSPDAIHALMNAKLDLSSRYGGHGTIEEMSEMPVVPKGLVGKVEEDHLFGWIKRISEGN